MAGESARRMSERLARRADHYRRGAEGEEATGEALTGLVPTSWVVIHDVAWPGRTVANIDHVAVGPTGVFVIDSKNWSGQVTLDGGVLRQGRRARTSTVRSAEAARAAVAALLPQMRPEHVYAVLCFSGEDGEAPDGCVDGVLVCSTESLLTLLTSRPAVVPDQSVRAVADTLRSLPSATERRPARVSVRSKARTTRRRSDRRTALTALAGFAAAVVLATNPGPVIALSNGFAELLTDQVQPPEAPVQPREPGDKRQQHKPPAKQKSQQDPPR